MIFINAYVLHTKITFVLFLDFKCYQLAKDTEPVLRWSVLLWHIFHCFSGKCRRKWERGLRWRGLLILPILCPVTGSRNSMRGLRLTRDGELSIQFWPHRVLSFYQSGKFSNKSQRPHRICWKQVSSSLRLSDFLKMYMIIPGGSLGEMIFTIIIAL